MDYPPSFSPFPPAPLSFGPRVVPHSGFGITSFIIAIGSALLEFALFAVAGYLETTMPGGLPEDSPITEMIGLGIIGGVLLNLVGIGLGIAGLCQRDRKKTFAVLGVVFSAVVMIGVIGLMIVGMNME